MTTDGKHRILGRQPFGNIRLLQIETKVDLGFSGALWHTTFGIADGAAPTPEEASSIPAVMS
ncbi:hypothetical protein [Azospirillum sp. B2RO_4]|uniref:hypothetical protein n=1 Tax=Azospirillum sp. B2RO_4 TaxID=3027796 RepID=UPI003DA9F179